MKQYKIGLWHIARIDNLFVFRRDRNQAREDVLKLWSKRHGLKVISITALRPRPYAA